MTAPGRLELIALDGLPEVRPGDDLVALIGNALDDQRIEPAADDVLIVAQKIVSKSEGRQLRLAEVEPGKRAVELAGLTGKDPRIVELVLRESLRVVRHTRDLIITEHRQGFVMANAGIDQSNVADGDVLLLPEDVDASAAGLQRGICDRYRVAVGVIVSDSVGRAWRLGTIGHALGVAGMTSLLDLRGAKDRFGRALRVSETALADNAAAAASLLMGESGEGRPVVLLRGLRGVCNDAQDGRRLLREAARDLFR